MVQVIFSLPEHGGPRLCAEQVAPCHGPDGALYLDHDELQLAVTTLSGLPEEELYLVHNGALVGQEGVRLPSGDLAVVAVAVMLRLPGGKGGFGSMLRSQGGRMASKQSTNYEACRDLNGRRLSLLTGAKAINAWKEKQQRAQKEKEERIKRKIEAAFNDEAPRPKKHFIQDVTYVQETEELVEAVSVAVDEGLLQNHKLEEEKEQRKAKEEVAVKAASKRFGYWNDEPDVSSEEEEGAASA